MTDPLDLTGGEIVLQGIKIIECPDDILAEVFDQIRMGCEAAQEEINRQSRGFGA